MQVFLARLPDLGLTGLRLPTEAEWAWAARCGVPTRWVGADRVQSVAVADARQTAPVAGLSSSAAGAFDLSGNLLQWQHDRWSRAPSAGVDVHSASGFARVARGSSWDFDPEDARVSYRISFTPGHRNVILGFRLLRTAP